MSMILKQVKEIRKYARLYEKEPRLGREIIGTTEVLYQAACTIKTLSAKLAAANMERSDQYYSGGWIPVSERLPEEPAEGLIDELEWKEYIVMIEGADIPTSLLYAGDGEWYRDGDFYRVTAWMPLPKPYNTDRGIEE